MPAKKTGKTYTAAQRAAFKAGKNAVTGYGAYKTKKQGGGGKAYYAKYKAAKAASAPADEGGWLASGLGAVGNALFPGIGGMAGRGLGSLIKSVTGFGDYEINQNSLVPEAGTPPLVANVAKNKVFILQHKEYISDVISSATPGAFKLESYYINPGQTGTFPWGCGVAANYEHYQIRGMLFEFRSMSANALNSTNTALGQVIMATQYNSSLPNFVNKYEMENYEYGQSTKPSDSCIHPIECARSESVLGDLYVRPGAVPAGDDQRLYDFGNFQIASNGVQGASVNLGELWVTYEIALYKPKLVTATGAMIPVFHAWSQTGVSNSAVFGTSRTEASANTLGITFTGAARIDFPASVKYGTYFIRYKMSGTATAMTYGATAFGNIVGCTINQVVITPIANPVTQDGWDITARIDVTGPGPHFEIQVASTAVSAGTPNMTLLISQVPLGMVPTSSW